MTYQITSSHLIYPTLARDTVKPFITLITDDIESFRKKMKEQYNCAFVNINYTEIPDMYERDKTIES